MNIRRRRQALGLSLDALANESSVSSTMLSEVERSVKNPTVRLAYQIARALGCTLTDLLEDGPSVPVYVTRAPQRHTLVEPTSGTVRHDLNGRTVNENLDLAWYELPPGQSAEDFGAIPQTRGASHITVLRGRVGVLLGGKTYDLDHGDSIAFGHQGPARFLNLGDSVAEFVLLADRAHAPREVMHHEH